MSHEQCKRRWSKKKKKEEEEEEEEEENADMKRQSKRYRSPISLRKHQYFKKKPRTITIRNIILFYF